jgi:CRISPR-associated endonuclease/helicase Cas3
MRALGIEDFPRFFESVHGQRPFDWQVRLLGEIDESDWPDCVAAPTGAGKTAVLDVALFHLAVEMSQKTEPRRAPMRVVFAVDRRVIVDQAYERAKKLALELSEAVTGLMRDVAEALGAPLHVEELRGGVPREDDWARAPNQPTILCTTIDQVGSRLLFRGYGVSESMAPVHAGLLGQDALILLDEAHLSAAFHETLGHIGRHRTRVTEPSPAPWKACALTATPSGNVSRVFHLDSNEREEKSIARRLKAKKNVTLIETKADFGSQEHIKVLADAAESFVTPGASIAIVVNRVALARAVWAEFARNGHEAILLTGRARPVDRDRLVAEYGPRLLSGRDSNTGDPLFVAATQCIEAGADFDFDAMATQIAPLDSLRQRFGRVDRLGLRSPTASAIVAAASEVSSKAVDRLYGDRLRRTWTWLVSKAEALDDAHTVDFGPDRMDALVENERSVARDASAEPKSAPVLRAADIDFLAITNPRPHPDPHLPLFLHGDARVEADVSIVWRADLDDPLDEDTAARIIAHLPPKSGEALPIPIWEARRWLLGTARGDVSDVEGDEASEAVDAERGRTALRWRGPDDEGTRLTGSVELRPGDLIVVPSSRGGCDAFGWDPQGTGFVTDVADAVAAPYRSRRAALRLHRTLWRDLSVDAWNVVLDSLAEHRDSSGLKVGRALIGAFSDWPSDADDHTAVQALCSRLRQFTKTRVEIHWPYESRADAGNPAGAIFVAPFGLPELRADLAPTEPVTDGGDAGSFRSASLGLAEHVGQVEAKVGSFAKGVGLPAKLRETLAFVARWHDAGKADPRFQAYLAGVSAPSEELLAKSGRPISGREAELRLSSGLPRGWRHEALSVRLAAQELDSNDSRLDPALALFLVGTHHGQGRPFFAHRDPWDGHRRMVAGRHLDPGAGPERLDFDWHGRDWAGLFDELKSRYGAWGLAWFEAIFRLADHRASEDAELRSKGDAG